MLDHLIRRVKVNRLENLLSDLIITNKIINYRQLQVAILRQIFQCILQINRVLKSYLTDTFPKQNFLRAKEIIMLKLNKLIDKNVFQGRDFHAHGERKALSDQVTSFAKGEYLLVNDVVVELGRGNDGVFFMVFRIQQKFLLPEFYDVGSVLEQVLVGFADHVDELESLLVLLKDNLTTRDAFVFILFMKRFIMS